MAYRSRRRKPTLRFYISIAFVIGLLGLLAFVIFSGPKTAKVMMDAMILTKNVSTVIARDERVIYSDGPVAIVNYLVAEGDKVDKGSPVAEVYRKGLNEKLLADRIDILQRIRDYQIKDRLNNTVVPELNESDAMIRNKFREISDVIQGKSKGDLVSLERKLKEFMDYRRNILKQKAQVDNTLSELYKSADDNEAKLEEARTTLFPEESGVISFYVDGNEGALSPERLLAPNLTIKKEEILQAQKSLVNVFERGSQGNQPIYRLINNYKWYCVILAENKNMEIPEIKEQKELQLTFRGYFDQPYNAKLVAIRNLPDGGGKLYIFEMSNDVGPLISIRSANAELSARFEGAKVPTKALYEQNGHTFVKAIQNGTAVTMEVRVLIRDQEFAIVEAQNEGDQLYNSMEVMLK